MFTLIVAGFAAFSLLVIALAALQLASVSVDGGGKGISDSALYFQGVTLASYLVPVVAYRNVKVGSFVAGFLGMLLMLPTFVNVIPIYAMMNINDISWGSRPSKEEVANDKRKKDLAKQQMNFSDFRFFVAAVWLICNLATGAFIVQV